MKSQSRSFFIARSLRTRIGHQLPRLAGSAIAALASSKAYGIGNVINQNLLNWQTAASTGRADILILGDSTVQSASWCIAIEKGATGKFGLAGSGVVPGAVPNGHDTGLNTNTNGFLKRFSYDFSLVRPNTGWSVIDADIPSNRAGYLPSYGYDSGPGGRSFFSATAGATAVGGLGFGLGTGASATPGSVLSPSAAYDMTVWTASQSTGSMGAARLNSSGAAITTLPNISTTTPATGLQKTVFSFGSNATSGAQSIVLNNVTNTTAFYARLMKSGAPTGATVSGWAMSGANSSTIVNNWNLISAEGQQAYLSAVIDGSSSGKLDVMLFTGLNDSKFMSTSSYKSNVQSFISSLGSTWSAMGRPAADLSFTLFGMYDANNAAYINSNMRLYAQQSHDLAVGNPSVSFIDLQPMQPGNTGLYLQADGVHLSQAGAEYFGPQIFAAMAPSAPSASVWSSSAAGNWNTSLNWTGGTPNVVDAVAYFGNSNSAPQTVFTHTGVTVGSLKFDSPNQYVIGGAGTLTFQVSSGAGSIIVQQGLHKLNLASVFASDTNISVATGASLTIGNPMTIRANKMVTTSGNLIIQAPLTIEPGGTLSIGPGPAAVLAGGLAINSNAQINVQQGAFIFEYANQPSSLATVKTQIESGFANGEWTGSGITSSSAAIAAATDHRTAVGFADNSILGLKTFGGQPSLSSTCVLVRYTYCGDNNLDGQVDSQDFSALAAGFSQSGQSWINGDYDFDGTVDTRDLDALASNFGQVLSSQTLGSVVPEPGAASLIVLVSAFAGTRRSTAAKPMRRSRRQ